MNTENKENAKQPHTLSLRDRGSLEMRGVTDVISFDEETIELSTVCGDLTVDGRELHIKVLNLAQGIVSVDGTVSALTYAEDRKSDSKGGKGFFGRRGR